MSIWEAITDDRRSFFAGSGGYRVLFSTITTSIENGALSLFHPICLPVIVVAIFVSL